MQKRKNRHMKTGENVDQMKKRYVERKKKMSIVYSKEQMDQKLNEMNTNPHTREPSTIDMGRDTQVAKTEIMTEDQAFGMERRSKYMKQNTASVSYSNFQVGDL